MNGPAQFDLKTREGRRVVVLTGDWTALTLGRGASRLASALKSQKNLQVDLCDIGRCDTAGAFAILRASQGR